MSLVDVEPIKTTAEQRRMVNTFLSLSGYGAVDLLSYNYDTGIFLTRGGGKYQLQNDKIHDLDGPPSNVEERM